MNKAGGHGVVLTILVTLLFLPEFMFVLASALNMMVWGYLFRKYFKHFLFRMKQRSQYWFWINVESLDKTYFDILRENNMPVRTKSKIDTHVYVPVCEREVPEAEQTQFTFKDLMHSEAVIVSDQLFGLSDTGAIDSLRAQTLSYKMMLKRMTGWKNLQDEHGEQIPFPSKDKALQALILDQLGNEVPEILSELERTFGSPDGKGRNDK